MEVTSRIVKICVSLVSIMVRVSMLVWIQLGFLDSAPTVLPNSNYKDWKHQSPSKARHRTPYIIPPRQVHTGMTIRDTERSELSERSSNIIFLTKVRKVTNHLISLFFHSSHAPTCSYHKHIHHSPKLKVYQHISNTYHWVYIFRVYYFDK